MKLKSTSLGILILMLFFGSIAASVLTGWWQTGKSGQGNKNQNGGDNETHQISTFHGVVNEYDGLGISITTDDEQVLYVQLGNSRYNQSIGFTPQAGEGVTVITSPNDEGTYNAVSVTLDATGVTYTFRSETNQPLWSGGGGNGNGNGNGGSH